MKKLILMAAAAMMVLASCTKTTVESIDGPKEIAFRTIESNLTKASTTIGESDNATMGVYAFNHSTTDEYFSNISFGGDAAGWKGTPSQYWPLTGALDFVVYSPYTDNTGNYKATYTSKVLTLTIPDNKDSQTDYLYGAEYFNNQSGNGGDGYTNPKNTTPINVNLKHALAKIQISVKGSSAVKVNKITLNDLTHAGTIAVTYDNSTDMATTTATPAGAYVKVGKSLYDAGTGVYTPLQAENALAETQTVLVFPNTAQTSFTITYKIGENPTELTTTYAIPASTWDSGKLYTYNITITAYEILFNPSVDTWETGTTDPIAL